VGVVASPPHRERMAQAGLGSIEPAEAMEALEYLLAGPVDQIALLKTTKLTAPGLAPEGGMIQTEEIVTLCPDRIPSSIHSLYNYRPPSRRLVHSKDTYVDKPELHEKEEA